MNENPTMRNPIRVSQFQNIGIMINVRSFQSFAIISSILQLVHLSSAFDCPGFPSPFDAVNECDNQDLFSDLPYDSTNLTGQELQAYLSFCCYMRVPSVISGGPTVFVESRIECCVADDVQIDAYGDKTRIPTAGSGHDAYIGLDDFRTRTTKPALLPRPPGSYSLSNHRVKAIVNNLVILRNLETGVVGSTGKSWEVEKVLFFYFDGYRANYIQVWSDTLPIADAFCDGGDMVCDSSPMDSTQKMKKAKKPKKVKKSKR